MGPESYVLRDVRVSVTELERLHLGTFERTHSGTFKVVGWKETDITKARPMKAAREGWGDLTGVLRRHTDGTGVFAMVETKVPKTGYQSEEQRRVQSWVESLGGIYILARNRHDFERVAFPIVGLPVPRTVADLEREQDERWADQPLPF